MNLVLLLPPFEFVRQESHVCKIKTVSNWSEIYPSLSPTSTHWWLLSFSDGLCICWNSSKKKKKTNYVGASLCSTRQSQPDILGISLVLWMALQTSTERKYLSRWNDKSLAACTIRAWSKSFWKYPLSSFASLTFFQLRVGQKPCQSFTYVGM